MGDGAIGKRFQDQTTARRDERIPISKGESPAEKYKKYPVDLRRVNLPDPETSGGLGLWSVLEKRRSRRLYTKDPVTLGQVSQLLWSAQGVTKEVKNYKLRTAPSGGALYPFETYVISNRVEGLDPGKYHFEITSHSLVELDRGDFNTDLARACAGQRVVQASACVFLWTAVFGRGTCKYGDRAYRYAYVDIGHLAQNLQLGAEALGLGACPIGAFFDDEVNSFIGIDGGSETAVYLMTVGRERT
jgi:SagB-type dehydrogenase family enzyme